MAGTVLAADLGGTKLALALVDSAGKVSARRTEPVDLSFQLGPVHQIARLARELGGHFSAAGVAIPGLVRRDGTVWAPNLPGWERVPLARLLAAKLRVPVVVESDRNATVLGESWRGVARGKSDVVVLIVGTGIGAGILSGGRLVRGAHELSGCAGWVALTGDDNPESLRCGELEALTAGPGIARAAGASNAQEAAGAARQNDTNARAIFRRAGELLGLAVANLISLFDPEVVVFGGGMAGAADLFWDELTRTALARCQPLAAKQVKLRLSRLGAEANLLGAARLALAIKNKPRPARRALRSPRPLR